MHELRFSEAIRHGGHTEGIESAWILKRVQDDRRMDSGNALTPRSGRGQGSGWRRVWVVVPGEPSVTKLVKRAVLYAGAHLVD